MPLVEYSDSEDSEPSKFTKSDLKRKRSPQNPSPLPSLPSTFHDLYASTTRLSSRDDPTLHNGRQRLIPHVDGNWPSHIYIECMSFPSPHPNLSLIGSKNRLLKGVHPATETSNRIDETLAAVSSVQGLHEYPVHSLSKSDLGAELPLHISLSRPISLSTDERQRFIDDLTTDINKAGLRP